MEVVKIFSQSTAPQRLLRISLDKLAKGFLALFPGRKKCEDPAHPGVGTGCALELMDAVSLAGVSMVAQHGVRRLLLVAGRQVFASWSAPLVYPLTQWLGAAAGADSAGCCQSVMESFGRISSSTCLFVALFALGNLDFAFALVSFSPSVFGCCLCSTSYFSGRVRCLVPQWIHVLLEAMDKFHIFSTCGDFRPEAFSLHSYRMEKCARLMLRVAVSLRAVRTLKLDIISTSSPWWRCWVFRRILHHFSRSSGCPRVERQFFELSSAHHCECSRAPVVPVSRGVSLPGDSAPGLAQLGSVMVTIHLMLNARI